MSSAVALGRVPDHIDPHAISGGADKLFTSQLLDGAEAVCATYSHCTFANISFKDVVLRRCEFLNCAFLDCYFRHTEFVNSYFTACKFEDCTFASPELIDSTFVFLEFRGCHIPFEDFEDALPVDPGYRMNLANELAREAETAGASKDARQYRLLAEAAKERHLWNLAWASGGVYYEKPRPSLTRVKHGLSWAGRKFNRALWGYGERGLVLARSFFVVGAVLFPLAFWHFAKEDLAYNGKALNLFDYELFSFDNLFGASGLSQVVATGDTVRWIATGELFTGFVFIGLFISLIFNWIRRR